MNEVVGRVFRRIGELVASRIVSDQSQVGKCAIVEAALHGHLLKIQQLVKSGVDVDARYPIVNSFNDDHTALLAASREGHLEVVGFLLENRADVNTVESTFGATPLHKAVYNGHADIAATLVKHPGVDVNVQGWTNGYTPLHDSLWHGFRECAKVILGAGARLDLFGYDGKLPVDIAKESFGEDDELVQEIMDKSNTERK